MNLTGYFSSRDFIEASSFNKEFDKKITSIL
jgi:hypothetical protein